MEVKLDDEMQATQLDKNSLTMSTKLKNYNNVNVQNLRPNFLFRDVKEPSILPKTYKGNHIIIISKPSNLQNFECNNASQLLKQNNQLPLLILKQDNSLSYNTQLQASSSHLNSRNKAVKTNLKEESSMKKELQQNSPTIICRPIKKSNPRNLGLSYNNGIENITNQKITLGSNHIKKGTESSVTSKIKLYSQSKEKLVSENLSPTHFVKCKLIQLKAQCNSKYEREKYKYSPSLQQFQVNENSRNINCATNLTKYTFSCHYCPCKFKIKSCLLTHLRVHRGEKPFKCEICNKAYTQKTDLVRHKQIHTGEKNFKCEICNASFIQKSNLRMHIEVHNGIRRFDCKVCGKKFSRKFHVQQHMAVHSSDKSFKCLLCPNTFKYQSNLKNHINTHIEAKPFGCKTCQRSYKTPKSFSSHIHMHKVADCYCTLCNASLSPKILILHVRKQHPKRIVNGNLSVFSNLSKSVEPSHSLNSLLEIKETELEKTDLLNFIDVLQPSTLNTLSQFDEIVKEESIDKLELEDASIIIGEEIKDGKDKYSKEIDNFKLLKAQSCDPLCLLA